MVNYENLDNHQTGIHDYFKYLKFGFGRATDLACIHIRRGRLTRKEAVKIIQEKSDKFPEIYLGYQLSEILDEIKISREDFIKICDKFTNKSLFQCNNKNELIKDQHGNLILKNNEYK